MDTVLLILKIIGIIILILLAVLLSLILLVLLVPIRYRINGRWGEETQLYARVSWFLHFVHVYFSLEKRKPLIRIRILGIPIYDSERPVKERPVRRKKNLTINKKKKSDFHHNNIKDELEDIQRLEDIERVDNTEKSVEAEKSAPVLKETPYIKETSEPKGTDDSIEVKLKKETIIQKIIARFKSIITKIKSFFKNVIDKIKGIFQSIAEAKRKGKMILDFLSDEINKDGFRFVYGNIRKFLKHILPKKIKANIIYGTGDPCSTGQILGVVAILYSMYGENVTIIPDFENQRFEGNAMARGRIRLVTILIIVIKLILDRRFIQLRENMRLLKEAL